MRCERREEHRIIQPRIHPPQLSRQHQQLHTPFVAEFVGLNNKVPAQVSDGQALFGASVPALGGSIASGTGLAMVRPESVTVTADPAGTATVSSVAFLGLISRVYCMLPDDLVIIAQMASAQARTFTPAIR